MMKYMTRKGFKKGSRPVIQTKELLKLLQDEGIDIKESRNASRVARIYGIEKAPFLEKEYTSTKTVGDKEYTYKNKPVKITTGVYYKPTKTELKNIKKQYDINQAKAFGMTEAGKKGAQERLEYGTKLLKSGKYSVTEADRMVKDKFGFGAKSTLTNVAKKLKGVKTGVGEQSPQSQIVREQLKRLNKSSVKTAIRSGNKNIETLSKRAGRILNIEPDLATRRIGQLIEAYAGDDKYLKVKDDLFLRRAQPLIEGLGKAGGSRLFGGIGSGLQRISAERSVAKDLGKTPGFFPSLRKRIQEIIPGNEYETDEIKNIRSSKRFGTSPYSVFLQGVKADINQEKGKTLDKQTSIYEGRLQKAKTFEEKRKIANEYNQKARAFVTEANKNLKPGELPVRALEISFEKPNKVIKNKAALDTYGDMFDDIYKKHGYSFKVPSDVRSADEVLQFLKGGRGQKQVLEGIRKGSPRLYAEAIPGSRYVGEFMSNMVDDLVKRRYGTFLLKGTGAGLVGYGIYDMGVGFAEGRSAPELAARAFGLDPIYRTAKEFYRLSPEAQEIQKQVNQQRSFDAAMEDPLDEALVTMRPRPEVSKQDLIKLEQEKEVAKEKIRQEDAQRSRSRMGLVDTAKQIFIEKTGQPFAVELKEGGPVDKGRRKFLKVSLTGLAAIPFIGPRLFKPAAKVVPEVVDVVTRSADSIPTYLNDLIGKVKMMGNSKLLGKPDSPDGFVEYELGDITVTEGNNFTRVRKRNERGEFLDSEVEMEIKQDPETNVLEYEEVTASPDAEGKLKDVDFGIDDNIHEDLKKFTYED